MLKAQRRLILVDSITEAASASATTLIVCGSHGGVSSGRYAIRAAPGAVVFNDAGVGKDGAGVKALAMLQDAGIAGCAVSHTSARIGEARSTLDEGVLSYVNAAALGAGGQPGMACRDWATHWLRLEA